MSDINEILETAHITISTATLKVVVNDISKFNVLFNPPSFLVEGDIYEEDTIWKEKMKFPSGVIYVSPWFEDNTLSIMVEYPFDLKKLSEWLSTFE